MPMQRCKFKISSMLTRVLCRALTEMQHDCHETQQTLQECMDNPVTLQGVCLAEAAEQLHDEDADQPEVPHRPSRAMLAAASLFECYERQILTVHGAIKVRGCMQYVASSECIVSHRHVGDSADPGLRV